MSDSFNNRWPVKRGTDRHPGFAKISENCEADYRRGEKGALMSMIVFCACENVPLPDWAAEVMLQAHQDWQSGELESWGDVFGKHYRGKSRKGARRDTPAHVIRVSQEVLRLHRQEEYPMDEALFEAVGKKFGIAATTVKKLFYGYKD